MLRIRAAAGRLHAFPVQSRVDQHPGAGFRFRRRPADGPERPRFAAVVLIRSGGVVCVHMQFAGPGGFLFPEVKASAVRQQG